MKNLLKPYRKLLTYYNNVEYVLPAVIFVSLIYLNTFLIVGVNLLKMMENLYANILVPILLLMLVGWLLYTTRFYQLFIGYKKRKLSFRIKISELFEDDAINISDDKKMQFGKYIFQRYWEILSKKTLENTLRLHVNWVFLVQFTNIVMLSFFYSLILISIQIHKGNLNFNWLFWVLSHVLVYFFVRRAAIKNLIKSNFNVIDNINRFRGKFVKDLPDNLMRFLDEID